MARYQTDKRDMIYQYYISDCLNLINQHKYLAKRYADIVDDIRKPKDEKTGDEIAADVILKAGLVEKKWN